MTIKQYYECHITMKGYPSIIEEIVTIQGWKFSKIDGDPTLGKGVKCYATRQYNKKYGLDYIVPEIEAVSLNIKNFAGAKILREKVELVVYDMRRKT